MLDFLELRKTALYARHVDLKRLLKNAHDIEESLLALDRLREIEGRLLVYESVFIGRAKTTEELEQILRVLKVKTMEKYLPKKSQDSEIVFLDIPKTIVFFKELELAEILQIVTARKKTEAKNNPMKKAKETPVRGLEELPELKLYTLAELVPVLKVGAPTLKKYIKNGRLAGSMVGGKWRVSAESLKAFIERGSEEPRKRTAKKEDLEKTDK